MFQTILRLPAVKSRTGKSRSSIYADVKNGSFPRPISLGPRTVGWLESSIESWIESRVRASSAFKGARK